MTDQDRLTNLGKRQVKAIIALAEYRKQNWLREIKEIISVYESWVARSHSHEQYDKDFIKNLIARQDHFVVTLEIAVANLK